MENKQREEESAFLLVEDLEEQERVVEAVLFTMGQSVSGQAGSGYGPGRGLCKESGFAFEKAI